MLAFVTVSNLVSLFEQLPYLFPENSQPSIEYLEDTWIG